MTIPPGITTEADLEHVAELAPRAKHELDLALGEAQRLQDRGQLDARRLVQMRIELDRARRGGARVTDVEHHATHPRLSSPRSARVQ